MNRKRCERQAKSIRGRFGLRWRRNQKHERRVSPVEQKPVNSYTLLVCAKIVKCGRGEREPTQDSMFSAGRKPTKQKGLSARGTSPPKAVFSVRGTIIRSSSFGAGHEPTQTEPWDRRGGSAQPTGPQELDTAISNGLELVSPTGLKLAKPLRSYSVAGSGKRAKKTGDAVRAALAVFECVIDRGDELKLPLDSCIEGPTLLIPSLCLVAGGCGEFCSPKYPRRRFGAQTLLPAPKSRGVQCLSETSVARLVYTQYSL